MSTGISATNSWLLGVNLSGADYNDPYTGRLGWDYIYPTNYELDHFASDGAKVVRIPLSLERMMPVAGGSLDPTQMSYFDALVAHANADGLKVIIDPSNFGYAYGTEIGSTELSNQQFANFWAKMAAHYSSNNNVIFELMNEPHDQAPSSWLTSANIAIAAIRGAGAMTQEILVPGTAWDSAYDLFETGNGTVFAGINDAARNFAIDVHSYFNQWSSGTDDNVLSTTIGVERLTEVTKWAEATGSKLFLSEFGVASSPIGLTAMSNMLAYMQKHADAWQGGTYYAAGPWMSSYMFSALTASGADTPQASVLAQFVSLSNQDTAAPFLSAAATYSGTTASTKDTLSGAVVDGLSGVALVEVFDAVNSVKHDLGAATVASDGSWSFLADNLENGTHAFTVVATDNAGNSTSAISVGALVNVDTIAPKLTASTNISGTGRKMDVNLVGTVTDTGSGVAKVEVYDVVNGAQHDLGAATIATGGSWSLVAGNLATGMHAFTAVATDNAGNSTSAVSAGATVLVGAVAPAASYITGVPLTGIRLTGVSDPGASIIVTDTVRNQSKVLGITTASINGVWSFLSPSGLGHIDLSTIHDYSVNAQDGAGNITSAPGSLFLTDTGHDVLTATSGASSVFAIMSDLGSDVINGFQAASAGSTSHDVVDFSGRGITSFNQVQAMMSGTGSTVITMTSSKTVTLTGLAPSELSSADFRFS